MFATPRILTSTLQAADGLKRVRRTMQPEDELLDLHPALGVRRLRGQTKHVPAPMPARMRLG